MGDDGVSRDSEDEGGDEMRWNEMTLLIVEDWYAGFQLNVGNNNERRDR